MSKKLQTIARPSEQFPQPVGRKPKYNDWSKDQLIEEVGRLCKRKKYGLVWEDKPEDVVEQCKTELPVLKEVKNKAIAKDKNGSVNILIEGDNYHALSVLNYTHKGKIDVIYIDPPYNRGGDFKYNDFYVDKDDPYKHSLWLSFMSIRLSVAKNLLSKKGIIFISIDEHEFAQLKLLCDRSFTGMYSIGPIVWQKASGGGNAKSMVMGHEYIICYARQPLNLTQKNLKHIGKNYTKSKKYIERNGKVYFINDDVVRKYFGKYPRGVERRCEYEELLKYKTKEIKADIDRKLSDDTYTLIQNPNNRRRHFICELVEIGDARMVLYSIIQGIFNAEGKDDLTELGFPEKIFDYPKPVRLIKLLIDSVLEKNLLVLDFFAGSGTTGQAVLQLNKEDGGNRRFILCTNNENNIATEVCYPRVAKVIGGYTDVKGKRIAGLGGNLKYFRTAFVGAEPNDKNKEALTKQSTEMLCMRENTFEPVKETQAVKIFRNQKQHTGIVFDENAIASLKKDVAKIGGVWSVYIFSLGNDTFDEEFEDMKQRITIAPIPEAILRVYRRLFQT